MSKIDKIIKESGLKVETIADLLGVSRQTLYNWAEKDKPEKLDKVEKAINKIHKNKFTAIINEDNKDLVSELKKEIENLKERLKDKEEIIELLKGKGA